MRPLQAMAFGARLHGGWLQGQMTASFTVASLGSLSFWQWWHLVTPTFFEILLLLMLQPKLSGHVFRSGTASR